MAYYKDLSSLLKAMQKDVHESMAADVFDDVVEVQREEIIETVYNSYPEPEYPFVYDRRKDDGGLSDVDNNVATFFTINGGMQMLIQNITKGHKDYKYKDTYITPVIIGGNGAYGMDYDFPYNRNNTEDLFLRPRNFISSTVRRLLRTLEHVESMKRGLQRKGYEFYK